MNSNSPSSSLHAQTGCRPVHARGFTAGPNMVENQDRAAGPLGHLAAGPSRAVGRGQLDHHGPWAADHYGPVFSKTPF